MDLPIEIGIVFRGFVLVSHEFKEVSTQVGNNVTKDLRGAFISAINSFISTAFHDTALEYFESGEILFVFMIGEVNPKDSRDNEPVILYGLLEKSKKKPDKLIKRFLDELNPILQLFIQRYNGTDFSELDNFTTFEKEIINFFK